MRASSLQYRFIYDHTTRTTLAVDSLGIPKFDYRHHLIKDILISA